MTLIGVKFYKTKANIFLCNYHSIEVLFLLWKNKFSGWIINFVDWYYD